jgi:prepilin signal peptidase PulO-like enzyme (type II secretory pathway)
MKYVNLVFFVLLILFTAVQYNDPDGPLWMVIYAIPAFWAGLAFLRADLLWQLTLRGLLTVCLLAAVVAVVYYWPTVPQWWSQSVWWEEEVAREGMGVMIVTVALLVAFFTGWRSRPIRPDNG